jgi:hypothetical protein
MINHIQKSCGIGAIESSTIIYEDNAAYVTQIQMGYINDSVRAQSLSLIPLTTSDSAP